VLDRLRRVYAIDAPEPALGLAHTIVGLHAIVLFPLTAPLVALIIAGLLVFHMRAVRRCLTAVGEAMGG